MIALLMMLAMDGSDGSNDYPPFYEFDSSAPYCELNAGESFIRSEGSSFYVKGDLVNLRKEPSTKATILTELSLGTSVDVGLCEKEETIAGREGCWYPVSTGQGRKEINGYLFSTTLTSCRLEVDLDNDGTDEYIYSSITADNQIQLRIQDPNDAPFVFWTTAKEVDSEYSGIVTFVPAEKSGQAMIVLTDTGQDYCGGGSTTQFYSYHPKLGMKEALDTYAYSDSPVYSWKEVSFQKDKKATAYYSSSTEGDPAYQYLEKESHFVKWDACAQEPISCKGATSYEDCYDIAEDKCNWKLECSAFTVRKIPGFTADFVLYTDQECLQKNTYSDRHWNFFAKGASTSDYVDEKDEESLCLESGVYGACPTPKETSIPPNMFMFEGDSIIFRKSTDYSLADESGRKMTAQELSTEGFLEDEEWWVLPNYGPAVKATVKRHFIISKKLCGDYGVFYATELEYAGEASLAILGSPPEVWKEPATSSLWSKKEAQQFIRSQLPKKYKKTMRSIDIIGDSEGWHGSVEWCCPRKDDPLYREDEEMFTFQYKLPVHLLENKSATFGDPQVLRVGMEGDYTPFLRRDIDGDGSAETLWLGCQNYWTQNGKTIVSSIGDCCGC